MLKHYRAVDGWLATHAYWDMGFDDAYAILNGYSVPRWERFQFENNHGRQWISFPYMFLVNDIVRSKSVKA